MSIKTCFNSIGVLFVMCMIYAAGYSGGKDQAALALTGQKICSTVR